VTPPAFIDVGEARFSMFTRRRKLQLFRHASDFILSSRFHGRRLPIAAAASDIAHLGLISR